MVHKFFFPTNIVSDATLTSFLQLNVKCKGPRGHKSVFECETHFHKWGRMQKKESNDSLMHSYFGCYTCAWVQNV
jgi:hypothetical protein